MSMKGKILDEVPTVRRATKIDWDTPALTARLHPGKVVCAAEKVRVGQISSVRGYTRAPFHDDQGDIQISMRNSYTENGVRFGDVFFKFIPKNKDEKSTEGSA
jgi:hypothetical protein